LPSNQLHKNADLLDLIKELKSAYKIGLISNIGTNWVLEHFLTTEEQALFDTFVFSFEAGLVKPDERIYRLASERLGEPPSACVMIDDLERNCQGATDSGMQAIALPELNPNAVRAKHAVKPLGLSTCKRPDLARSSRS